MTTIAGLVVVLVLVIQKISVAVRPDQEPVFLVMEPVFQAVIIVVIAAAAAAHCLGVTPEAFALPWESLPECTAALKSLGNLRASPWRMTLHTIPPSSPPCSLPLCGWGTTLYGLCSSPTPIPHLQPAGGFCPGAVHSQPPGDDGDPGCAGGEQVGHPHQRPGGEVPGSVWFDSFEKIADYVMEQAQPGDLILTLGGGDIYKCANLIVEKYKARQP